MKRIFCTVLSAALLFCLASCSSSSSGTSGNSSGGNSGGTASSAKAPEVFDTALTAAIENAGAFCEELGEVDADVMYMRCHLEEYGIARDELTECSSLLATGATDQVSVMVFSWKDGTSEERCAKVQEALEHYKEGLIKDYETYGPEEVPKLENALIQQKGDSFLFLVATDMDAAKSVIP